MLPSHTAMKTNIRTKRVTQYPAPSDSMHIYGTSPWNKELLKINKMVILGTIIPKENITNNWTQVQYPHIQLVFN